MPLIALERRIRLFSIKLGRVMVSSSEMVTAVVNGANVVSPSLKFPRFRSVIFFKRYSLRFTDIL